MNRTIKILGSGVALGVYIPGLTIFSQLKEQNINVEFCVFESFFFNDKKDKILSNKQAFHRNFKVALVGQKIAGDMSQYIDPVLLDKLFKKWHKEEITDFLVFSGYWIPILERFLKNYESKPLNCTLCHMDATESTSWKNYNYLKNEFNNIWFFDYANTKVNFYLNIGNHNPVPFNKRNNRFTIHGGGWGMGTYSNYIPELLQNKIQLDIITYEYGDVNKINSNSAYYMIDPTWRSWEQSGERGFVFPPFCEIVDGEEPNYKSNSNYSDAYDLMRNNYGIISKPGGATLLDSISSATPIILLESFGEYEESNSKLWQKLGFGITYDNWKKSNFSFKLLSELHKNILDYRTNINDFTSFYLTDLPSISNKITSK